VERARPDRDLLVFVGAPALSGVGGRRAVPRDLAPGAARVRPGGGHRLVLAGRRRGHRKGPPGGSQDRPEPHRQSEKGAKRSVLTEAAGVPLGLAHEGANRNDHLLLKGTLDSLPIERPEPTEQAPQGICLDKAYDNQETRELVGDYDLRPHIRSRGEELEARERNPDWRARRWVVEACHSWLNRNRAILIRWSKKDQNHLALLQLASGLIAFKKARAASLQAALPG
jgi:Transposase DDE domain